MQTIAKAVNTSCNTVKKYLRLIEVKGVSYDKLLQMEDAALDGFLQKGLYCCNTCPNELYIYTVGNRCAGNTPSNGSQVNSVNVPSCCVTRSRTSLLVALFMALQNNNPIALAGRLTIVIGILPYF